jgi:hypothetical protein
MINRRKFLALTGLTPILPVLSNIRCTEKSTQKTIETKTENRVMVGINKPPRNFFTIDNSAWFYGNSHEVLQRAIHHLEWLGGGTIYLQNCDYVLDDTLIFNGTIPIRIIGAPNFKSKFQIASKYNNVSKYFRCQFSSKPSKVEVIRCLFKIDDGSFSKSYF